MAITITLTEAQRDAIRQAMDEQVEMLSDEEVEVLASKLNGQIDLPFIGEQTEGVVFVKTVRLFDRLLYQNLPNELYGLVKNTSDGLSDADALALKNILATRLNKSFDIPYLPEWIEQQIFEALIGLIVEAMRKELSILTLPDNK